MILPNLDPIAFSIGPLAIRWYSLAYIAGILFTFFWLKNYKNNKEQSGKLFTAKALDDWLLWAVLSVLLGGRVGYVLFYNFSYFLENPLEIFAFWHGGMSFHGGLIGATIGMWFFAKRHKIDFLKLTDALSVAAPIGLFFGRLANFVNMELYGRVTESSFGIVFPNSGDGLPRHPSQLYEAGLEGLASFVILFLLHRFSRFSQDRGFLSGIFLVLYGSSRIFVENFREPDEQLGFLQFGIFGEFSERFLSEITMGQVLSLPIILFGIFMVFFSQKSKKNLPQA